MTMGYDRLGEVSKFPLMFRDMIQAAIDRLAEP